MSNTNVKKNKIVLSDYNYRRDIENRLLMADLSTFEVDFLGEIIHSSLKTTVKHLAEALETTESQVIAAIDKLSPTKLVSRQGDQVIVDKEMRKYYESQIIKFDDDFEAGMEFLQGLLSKVPIHHLPSWYSISRTSDNIFLSIIEKHLHSPKIYERYLQELHFDDPVLTSMLKDLYEAPDLKIPSTTFIEKYKLTREQFEEYMLLLEYSFACCLCYHRVGDMWQEMVTPFSEWKEYLEFQRKTTPKPIKDIENIVRKHPHDFGFILDITQVLKSIQKKPIKLDMQGAHPALPESIPGATLGNTSANYRSGILNAILFFHMGEIKKDTLHILGHGAEWAKHPFQEQALTVYKMPLSLCSAVRTDHHQFSERDLRETEKSLKRVLTSGWIYFEDFMKGLTAPIGTAEPVALLNKGKRWKYTLPTYTAEETALVEATLFERLFACGMVAAGEHKGKPCFCVTAFGRMTLGD